MPQFIPVAISAIGTAVGGSTLLYGTLAIASSVAIGSYQQRQARAKAKRDANAAQVDRMVNVVSTTAPRELVLGRVRKGGHVAFRGSTGTNKTTFMMVLSIAAHEIDGIERIYFNDQPIDVDANGWVTTEPYRQTRRDTFSGDTPPAEGTYVPGSLTSTTRTQSDTGETVAFYYWQVDTFTYHARVRWDLGGGTSVADSRTIALFPSLWGPGHRGQGIAKLYVEFSYSENAFPSGIPMVSALVRGAKVYDPRSGLTAWSDNPALLARHVYQHPFFGKATVSADEDSRFIAAANACDTAQNWVVNGVTTTARLYRAGLVANYGTPARSLLDDLTQAMAGMWAFAGGEMFIRAGVYTASVKTLTDSDLAVVQRSGESEQQDQLSIAVHRERAQKFNVVNPRIWDAEQDYKQVALSPVRGEALITRDGAELAQEVTLSAVGFAPQAQHVCGVMMRDARDALTVEAPFKMTAWPVELFDTIAWTSSRYGWSSKTFVVLGRRWDRARGVVWLTLKETAAAIFTPNASFLPNGYARNTANPSPWNVAPPVLSASGIFSGTDELVLQADGTVQTRARVTWPAITDSSVTMGGQVDVEWSAGGSPWQRVTVGGDTTEAILTGPPDGQTIVIRARARNNIAVSNWSLQVGHAVIGKTQPPSDVTVFSIRGQALEWSAVNDLDLEGYEIRFNYGNSTAWGTATPMHVGVITESPWTPQVLPPGQITLLIKAKDTTGNYSANAAVIVANLGDVILENLILGYDDKAAGFPGTKTNCAVSGGNLLADDSGDLFWGANGGNFWGAGAAIFWPTATYLAMDYETEYTVGPTEAGARLTLDVSVAAQSYTLEYRYDSQDLFWGDDAALMWERSDSAAFWPPLMAWQTWPGELTNVPEGAIQFRITTQAGTVQGTVSTLTLQFDVEDEFEELDDIAISAAGTRLPIAKVYRQINNVQLTLQDSGGTAVSVFIADKDETLGPLIYCKNAAGSMVAGVLDARIQGVKG